MPKNDDTVPPAVGLGSHSGQLGAGPTDDGLVPLPPQPEGVPWSTSEWPSGEAPAGLAPLLDAAFDPGGPLVTTYAVAVVHQGRLVAERYGNALPHFDRPEEPVTVDTPLLSWSMAKSVLHATVGLLTADGRIDPSAAPKGIPWRRPAGGGAAGADDPRRAITLQQMLEMRDGLDFNEDYVDDKVSDTIAMLYGEGQDDVVAYVAARPPRHEPGEVFNYSSGTSNLVSAAAAQALGGRAELEPYLRDRLFGPIGMSSIRLGYDAAGTWVASSFSYATARDWARFGYLYLRNGEWDGRRVLPAGWVDHGRRPKSVDPVEGVGYGAHWWLVDDGRGTFWASGYTGQCIVVCPALDVVLVRLGNTPAEHYRELRDWRAAVLDAFET